MALIISMKSSNFYKNRVEIIATEEKQKYDVYDLVLNPKNQYSFEEFLNTSYGPKLQTFYMWLYCNSNSYFRKDIFSIREQLHLYKITEFNKSKAIEKITEAIDKHFPFVRIIFIDLQGSHSEESWTLYLTVEVDGQQDSISLAI